MTLKQKTKRKDMPKDHQNHIPVLLNEVLEVLKPQKGETLLDATAGYGGHSKEILGRTFQDEGSVLVDRDSYATEELKATFAGRDVLIMQDNFADAAKKLADDGKKFDLILADLGVSSPHLDNKNRGFSFKEDGPLDMRMDVSQEITASTIVNRASNDDLARILKEYGEEFRAHRIVRAIVSNRPITSTGQLAKVIENAIRGKRQKVHPATKTFQALRIAVNDELGQLERSLPIWLNLLNPGGRIAIISFHSLEDRIIKRFLKSRSGPGYDTELNLATKKPITAGHDELVFNPRARSAKLRAAVKIKKQKEGA